MGRTRLALGAAAAVAGALLFGGALTDSSSSPPPEPRPDVAAAQLLQGFSPSDTASYVRRLERRVADRRNDGRSLVLLGLAYQQRARETGDPSFYPRAEQALRRGLALDGDPYLATTGLAMLAASRHRFREAHALAARAVRMRPRSPAAYGPLGDALVELGRYREAFAAFDRMATLKPNVASYARVAYARELLGRPRDAIAAMELAVDATVGLREPAAWTLVQLGNLHFGTGRLGPAARAYRDALARMPGYPYAVAGLARVQGARGRTDRAVALYRRALERIPLPEFAAGLAATLRAAGREAEARDVDRLVAAIERLLAANGVRTELETALYDLDRGVGLEAALARARAAYRDRRSLEADDVLAWALYKNGRCREARAHSARALRLGTRDALKLFHRGMIERCVGRREEARSFLARALATNPSFSPLYAPIAKEALR